MTPARDEAAATPEPITVDDLRHKALAVRDAARQEAKDLLQENQVRIVIAAALAGALALSVAYYLGTRAGRREARRREAARRR